MSAERDLDYPVSLVGGTRERSVNAKFHDLRSWKHGLLPQEEV
jgi:hypothetical protein